MALPSRVKLGDFVLEKKIGEGGMGTVFLARQESLDRQVALKMLPRQFSENPEFVERFRREARAAANLVHPNVVQIYSVGEERGVHYFAMEYVEGKSLEDMLDGGRHFEVEEALGIVTDVAKALEAAAEKNIVHRDLKPANIMVDRKGVVKVMDFGLAKPGGEVNNITQPGLIVGTPAYMSPEQGAGEEVDCRSDIYSLGMVFYKLLTGQVAFTGDNPGTIIYKHLHEPPVPPSQLNPRVPAKVEEIVLRCLAKKPDDRYTGAVELLGALRSFRTGETRTDPTIMLNKDGRPDADRTISLAPPRPPRGGVVTPGPQSVSPAAPGAAAPGSRRSALPAVLAAAALLVVGLGIGGYFYLSSRAPTPPPTTSTTPEINKTPAPEVVKTPEPGNPPVAGKVPDPVKTPEPANPPKGPELFTMSLSRLAGLIPLDAQAELITATGRRPINPARPLDVTGLPAGQYTLGIARRGYETRLVALELSAEGLKPALDARAVELQPTEELLRPYLKAEQLLGVEKPDAANARDALLEIAKVAALDPAFRNTAELRRKAERVAADEDSRWQNSFARAEALMKEKNYAEAKAVFESIPAGHVLSNNARTQMKIATDALAEIADNQARFKGSLEEGKFVDAEANLRKLEVLAPRGEIAEPSVRLAEARKLWDAANALFGKGRYGEAKAKYEELLAGPSPRCAEARKAADNCDAVANAAGEIEKRFARAEGQLTAKDYAGCLSTLAEVARLGPSEADKGRCGEMRSRVEVTREAEAVGRQMAAFDEAFAKGDVDGLGRVLDRNVRGFAVSFEEDARGFFGANVEMIECAHKISGPSIIERSGDDAPSKLQAQSEWKFKVRLPEAGRTVAGTVRQALTFNCVRGAWLLAAAAPGADKPKLEASGERPKAAGVVSGKVVAVDGDRVTIDRGSADGVTEGMVFEIFSDAKVVRLPLAGDEPIFVEERPVASVEAKRVDRNSTVCAFRREAGAEARKKVVRGMLVATSLAKSGTVGAAPVILGHGAAPADEVPAGAEIVVRLEVPAGDVRHIVYQWSADDGLLSAARTAEPALVWTAPAAKGAYKIAVVAVSTAGEMSSVCQIAVRSSGPSEVPPKGLELCGRFGEPTAIEECRDVAFDETSRGFVLDAGKRRVLALDAEFRPRRESAQYPSSTKLERLAVSRGVLYCLDTKACVVKRYALPAGADPFTGKALEPAGADIGSEGRGNGRLRTPVDLTVSSGGDVCVLDADKDAPSVQVFSAATGAFLQSFGSAGAGFGALSQPVAIEAGPAGAIFVLDAELKKVVVFRDGRPSAEFACGEKKSALADIAYDASTDSLLVLDAGFKSASAFSPAGTLRPLAALGLGRPGPGELLDATRLAANRAGSVLVVSGEGKLINRFLLPLASADRPAGEASRASEFLGRLGGAVLSADMKLAAAADGTLWALDRKADVLRRFDSRGWLLAEFGKGIIDEGEAVVCDELGHAVVLDSGDYTIKTFDATGKLLGKAGKKGSPPEGLSSAIALAMAGPGAVLVASNVSKGGVVRMDLSGAAANLPHAAGEIAKPALVAVDAAGNVYVARSSGEVSRWDGADGSKSAWGQPIKGLAGLSACGSWVLALDSKDRAVLVCDPKTGKALTRTALPADCKEPAALTTAAAEMLWAFDADARCVVQYRPTR